MIEHFFHKADAAVCWEQRRDPSDRYNRVLSQIVYGSSKP